MATDHNSTYYFEPPADARDLPSARERNRAEWPIAMPVDRGYRVSARDIPNRDTPIAVCRSNRLAVGAEHHGTHPLVGPRDRIGDLARGNLPKLDLAVSASRSQHFAVGAERHGVNPVMRGELRDSDVVRSVERRHRVAGDEFPQSDAPIGVPRGECLAVGIECHGHHSDSVGIAERLGVAKGRDGLEVAASHSLIVPSLFPAAIVFPSELNATPSTAPACPSKVAIFNPVFGSQSLMVSSALPEARSLPSGLYAIPATVPAVWPFPRIALSVGSPADAQRH